MILYYDFGEYEIEVEDVAKAIANTYKKDNSNKALKVSKNDNSLELFITELIYDDVLDEQYIEDYYLEDIMNYWEDKAARECKEAEDEARERGSMLSDYVLRGSL